MKLIVGLGNPGHEYEKTRHNIGFMVIDKIAEELKINGFREKFKGLLSEAIIKDEKVFLLKPQTYMNLSGDSIRELINFYKIDPVKDMIIIYDDLDLDFGRLRIKEKGGAGGHNGIKSIISHFDKDFLRIKCGIGKPENREQVVNYVLNNFPKETTQELSEMIEKAAKAAISLSRAKSVEKVIAKFNKK